jgi:hypothetical protein
MALAMLGALALAAVACTSSSEPAPSTIAEAYASAHPTGALPSSLHTVDLSREEVGRCASALVGDGVRILLPTQLPPGFRPAAPYIAVGDGSARPNPEGWGGSYRVSYTDEEGLLVMTVGAESLPDGVSWSADRLRIDGRRARAGRAGGAIVVATVDRRPRIVITGRRVPRGWVLETARSVAPWR